MPYTQMTNPVQKVSYGELLNRHSTYLNLPGDGLEDF